MPKGSHPGNITARFIIDAKRLNKWAKANGSPEQREFADNMLKVCMHATQIFPNNSPAGSKPRSEVWLAGEAAGHLFNLTGVREPPPADVDIHEWHAGFFSSAIKPKG
jgi:hypothetical protein